MYCVIQKVQNKKPNHYGTPKNLISTKTTFTIDGTIKTSYGYRYSDERFERPIKDAYKISIHKSYRESGKVKKKQWVICTMSYYDLLEHWPGDSIHSRILKQKLKEMNITEEQLWGMVYEKLDPLIDKIKAKYETTEECKTNEKHKKILERYRTAKHKFEEVYGTGEYDCCYDVFGTLQNQEYLDQLKERKKAQEEYTKRSYQNSYYSNYDDYFKSSYQVSNQNNYTEQEKEMLKKIYRVASKKFHPDITNDDGTMMKFLTHLKEQWGI